MCLFKEGRKEGGVRMEGQRDHGREAGKSDQVMTFCGKIAEKQINCS
jgi:hypothetical protein